MFVLLGIWPTSWSLADDLTASVAHRFARAKTEAVPDFQKHVVPLLGRLGCNSAKCHGSFQGRGGFRLSLFGFDFRADHKAIAARRVNVKDPATSLILRKPTEQDDHEGGLRFKLGSWEHHLMRRWIESGAKGATFASTANIKSDDKKAEFFLTKVKPLLENHCYECHGFDNQKGGLQLVSRESLLAGGESGPAAVAGKPADSRLINAILYADDELQMPPSGKLDRKEVAVLTQWVKMGIPWPSELDAKPQDTARVLRQLYFSPAEIVFRKTDEARQVQIVAEWESGEREDVTCLTRFNSNDNSIVEIDMDGVARSKGVGDTHIVARYDNGVVAIPVLRSFAHKRISNAATQESAHPVDRLVIDKLSKLGLTPSGVCSDAEFLRRVSIDMTGSLPTPNEVIAFIKDTRPDKRNRKIDELLKRKSYAAWWANKLCDFTGCNPASIRGLLEVATEEGYVQASRWYDWIYDRVEEDVPYDELVEGIMLADLSSSGPLNRGTGMPVFWRRQSLKEPKDTAMSVAHSFLGIQLQCAECHKHPFDRWTQSDFSDFARFFTSVTRTRGLSPANTDRELKLLRSESIKLKAEDDPREPIMRWMKRKDNPWFARAFVNRVWAGYFHVGIVDPPDQFTPANPPSNPKLLDWLTQGFIENEYDMKWLHRQIATSQTYQRSWRPNETNRNDRRNFSRAIPRRIPAEVVYDAMKQATASQDRQLEVRTNLKRRASGHLSMRMAGTHAMRVFGKPDRAINCDCERVNKPTLLQAIFVQNDPLVRMRLADSGWLVTIEEDVEAGKKPDHSELVDQVWLRTVSRQPSKAEKARALEHLKSVDSLVEGVNDLMWAMFNTKEFLLNH